MLIFQLLLVKFLAFNTASPPKTYAFDYIAEYEFRKSDTSAVRQIYVLTNSKDNSFNAMLIVKDQETAYLDFRDERGIKSSTLLNITAFFKAETVTYNCSGIIKSKPGSSADKALETFSATADTIIDGKPYTQYRLKLDNGMDGDAWKYGTATYIVESDTEFHSPFKFYATYSDGYHLPSTGFPNGIARDIFFRDSRSGTIQNRYVLKNHASYKKFLKLPECR